MVYHNVNLARTSYCYFDPYLDTEEFLILVTTIFGSPLKITLHPPDISNVKVSVAPSVTEAEPFTPIVAVFVASPRASIVPEPDPDTFKSVVEPEIFTFEDPDVLTTTLELLPLTLIVDEPDGSKVNSFPLFANLRFEDPDVLAVILSADTVISAFALFDIVISAVFALMFRLEIIVFPDIFKENEVAVSNGVVELIDELSDILILLIVGIKITAFKTGFSAFLPLNIFLTSEGIDLVSRDMYRVWALT